jgi:dTDP-L-rhamnose 4-epimerase
MNKILITGGAGFIGSNLALKLLDKGYRITIIDSLSEQIHGTKPEITSPLYNSIKGKTIFIKASINSKPDLIQAIADNEIIVHFAAETGTGQSMCQIERYAQVNITGTAVLLDILVNHKHNVQKLLVASSRAVYGEGKYFSDEYGIVYPELRTSEFMDKGDFEVKYPGCASPLSQMPTDENSMLHPSSVYGITKLNQEQMVMTVCKAIKIPSVALRYQNVYGPGQSLTNPYTGIISIFSTQIKNGNTINIFEDGKESRDFVFIDDVVDATMMSIENPNANYQIFNVGTGTPINILTVAKTLIALYKRKVPVFISGNYRLGDIRHNTADMSKMNNHLGFYPRISFEEGIRSFTKWVNNQDIQKDKFLDSIEEMKTKGLFK